MFFRKVKCVFASGVRVCSWTRRDIVASGVQLTRLTLLMGKWRQFKFYLNKSRSCKYAQYHIRIASSFLLISSSSSAHSCPLLNIGLPWSVTRCSTLCFPDLVPTGDPANVIGPLIYNGNILIRMLCFLCLPRTAQIYVKP